MAYRRKEISLCEKLLLSIGETADYSGLGINKIRSLLAEPDCPFALTVGRKQMIKRNEFEKFVSQSRNI